MPKPHRPSAAGGASRSEGPSRSYLNRVAGSVRASHSVGRKCNRNLNPNRDHLVAVQGRAKLEYVGNSQRGLVKLLESPDTDPVSQRAKRASAYYLLLLGPPAKEAVPKVQKMLPEGKHKQRVTDLLHGFIRKAAE